MRKIRYLQESVNFRLQLDFKVCESVFIYRSLGQTSDGFKKFTDSLKLTLDTNLIAESNCSTSRL